MPESEDIRPQIRRVPRVEWRSRTAALLVAIGLLCLPSAGDQPQPLRDGRAVGSAVGIRASRASQDRRDGPRVPQSPSLRALSQAVPRDLGPDQYFTGQPWQGDPGITVSVADLMAQEREAARTRTFVLHDAKPIERADWPKRANPDAPAVAAWSAEGPVGAVAQAARLNPQTVGTSWLGPTVAESGYIPPDSMGAVGPTQVLVLANGRFKVYDKAGNLGPLDVTDNLFFNTVRNGYDVSDPHVRYDRLTGRWFITVINVSDHTYPGSIEPPNRILIAVSSGSTITSSSSFTFFQFQHDLIGPTPNPDTGGFADYDTLGVDAHALYIGINEFGPSSFLGSTGYVVNKANLLVGSLTVTAFRSICTGGVQGPYTPQGVDNDDPNSTEGYFIGVDSLVFSLLQVRRIIDPGGTPSISGNLAVTVPTTYFPLSQVASGSTRNLDAIDDRLFAAHMMKNKLTGVTSLWTAHNIAVNTSGVGGASGTRNGSRWYQLGSMTTTPALVQSGTLFDSSATNPLGFWMPSVAMSGQGHMAIGSSVASAVTFAGVAVAGRLSGDSSGTTEAMTLAQAGVSSYNLGTPNPQRWGDYSQVVVDPNDNQTMWTFQEYTNATNSWGVRAIKLIAPPPATPTLASPGSVAAGQPSVSVSVTGTSSSGSGFFDPGSDSGGPGFANRVSASVNGGVTVNGVTYVDPTHVTLNISTVGATAGSKNITIQNPDGQSATLVGAFVVTSGAPVVTLHPGNSSVGAGAMASFTSTATGDPVISIQWQVSTPRPGVWFDIAGATSSPLTFTAALTDNGKQYRAVFTNGAGSATSNPATLTVVTNPAPPVITTQPVGQTVAGGGMASFTAAAAGGPAPTMQWQIGTASAGNTGASDGITWSDIPGATTSPLTFTAALGDNRKLYRAVFTNGSGSATTRPAMLIVVATLTAPVVTTSPLPQTVAAGGTATFTAAATGSPAPAVQWQTGIVRGMWFSIPGARGTTYSFTVAAIDNGRQYRAVFANAAGTATTSAALLTVSGLAPVPGAPPSALLDEGRQIPGIQTAQAQTAVVNFSDLARLEAMQAAPAGPERGIAINHKAHAEPDPDAVLAIPAPVHPVAQQVATTLPLVASPAPAVSYIGLDDIAAVGSGFSYIPPDTDGAVGPTRIMNSLNNNYRVLDKATGATISTVSMATFWAGTGATGPFDPKTLYDPYNGRFIVAGVSNAASAASSVLIGLSATSDPNGAWTLYRYQICSTAACGAGTDWWADFPCIGFNKNWVAVTVNMFNTTSGAFHESRILGVDYPTLRGGTYSATLFTGLNDFSIQPAVTYSATENTLYAPAHWSSAGRSYHLNTITGTAAAPVYTQGPLLAHPVLSAWTQPSGNIAPQATEPGTGAVASVDSGDARIVDAVFRNGNIWYAQTVGLPAGGLTHTAAQWVRLDTGGAFVDGGRVEDPTATSSNGGKWYAYPSIAVNAGDDVLFGFSQFASSQFPSAGYAFRAAADAAGAMRDVVVSKAGDGFYYKTYSGSRNRWGDFSVTQVDPVDDTSMWSVQEYAKAQVGTGNGSGRWGTWWVNVVPPGGAPVVATNPGSQSVGRGAMASFTSTATGDLPMTSQWQVSTPRPGVWFNVAGATSSPLIFTAALADNGKQYRAVFTNAFGSATSNPATLTVVASPAPPVITSQPTGQTVVDGTMASFVAAAAGGPAPAVQWQVGTPGGGNTGASDGITWSDVPGATAATLSFTAVLGDNGKLYRAVFTNGSGTATTLPARLSVVASLTAPVVTTSPLPQTVAAGGTATFTAAATGSPTPTVQWQTGTVRGMWNSIPGATATTYSFTVAASDSGRQYRALFTNAAGTATTNAATLTVSAPDPLPDTEGSVTGPPSRTP